MNVKAAHDFFSLFDCILRIVAVRNLYIFMSHKLGNHFNIYAVFKQIEPVQRNEDYTIIRTGTSYGLALYDRIVLQGDRVKENEIIYN